MANSCCTLPNRTYRLGAEPGRRRRACRIGRRAGWREWESVQETTTAGKVIYLKDDR